MKWIKASERLPEKRHNYFVKMLTPRNSVMKQYVWNSTCVFDGEKFVDDVNRGELLNGNTVVEWLDESGSEPEGKEAVELLDDIDFELAHLEDFTHGEHGKRITELRKRVSNFRKIWKAEAK